MSNEPVRASASHQATATPPAASRATLRAFVALGLWTVVVLGLSSDPFSASGTSRILLPLLRLLLPDLSPDALAFAHGAIRKAAHVFEYAVLAALGLRAFALGAGRLLAAARPRHALAAFLYAVAVAAADESRQATSDARTGTPRDVALDAAGAAAGIAILDFSARRRAGTLAGR